MVQAMTKDGQSRPWTAATLLGASRSHLRALPDTPAVEASPPSVPGRQTVMARRGRDETTETCSPTSPLPRSFGSFPAPALRAQKGAATMAPLDVLPRAES